MGKSCYVVLLVLCFFCAPIKAAIYPMPAPGDDIVGTEVFTVNVQNGDSSTKIRQRYEISFKELTDANPSVNFDRLKVGQEIVIPSQLILPQYREGIVINLVELRLYYFTPDGKYVLTYPVGLGRENWRTPTTITSVARKAANPTWYVPDSIREYTYERKGEELPDFIPPGPDNPLGAFALYLARRGYLIHGTNDQNSVGLYISSGCIRMQSEAIAKLYEIVPIGTPVYLIHHANKAGWLGSKLYLESHSSISLNEKPSYLNYKDAATAIEQVVADYPATVNWQLVQQTERQHRGIPVMIGVYNNEQNEKSE